MCKSKRRWNIAVGATFFVAGASIFIWLALIVIKITILLKLSVLMFASIFFTTVFAVVYYLSRGR